MKISLNLLRQFTDIRLSIDKLQELISSRIAEIESYESLAERYENIVVAKIIEAKPHPNATKLGLYKIDTSKLKTQVVAGDKSLKSGDKVAYIPPGTVVPSSFGSDSPIIIKKTKLRGKSSNGMLASAAELGFSDDHEGVLVLEPSAKLGTKLSSLYDLDDQILEIETKTLTHRPDCFGHLGFAREVAGILDLQFKSPKWYLKGLAEIEESTSLRLSLKNDIPEVVPNITLRAYENVEIKSSPIQIQTYLSRLGIRPINNIVDLSNFVMVMTAQPLHIFDYEKVMKLSKKPGAAIEVRYPKKGEKLKLLDGSVIEPHKDAALICSDTTPLAVGGAMGGADTEVDDSTTKIIVEAANFDLYSIRQTSMKHGIFTEAVTRFARGQDPMQCRKVQDFAVLLIEQWSGGNVASPLLEELSKTAKRKPLKLSVSAEFINQRLGSSQSAEKMAKSLNNVELMTVLKNEALVVTVPTWRPDLNIAEDIVEEVGRLNGYDSIQVNLPNRTIAAVEQNNTLFIETELRQLMSSAGANEALTYNFVSEKLLADLDVDQNSAFHIRNSISPQLQYMRTTITASLLEKVYANLRAGGSRFAIYEIGKSHSKKFMQDDLPIENRSLAAVFAAGDKFAPAGASFYQIKAFCRQIAAQGHFDIQYLKLSSLVKSSWLTPVASLLQPKRSAMIKSQSKTLGVIGELKPKYLANLKLPTATALMELDLSEIEKLWQQQANYSALSKFPSTTQDITLSLGDNYSYQDMESLISSSLKKNNLEYSIEPLSIYRAKKSDKTRNLSFRLSLSSHSGTLMTKDINKLLDDISLAANKQFNAKRI